MCLHAYVEKYYPLVATEKTLSFKSLWNKMQKDGVSKHENYITPDTEFQLTDNHMTLSLSGLYQLSLIPCDHKY